MMLAIDLLYIALIIPSTPSFIRAVIMKGCWILSKDFLHLFWWSHSFYLCFC
jgi:hypothetical protein